MTHKPDLSRLSITQLAALTRRKPETIRRKLDGLKPVQTDGRTRVYASAQALDRIYGGEGLDLSTERARLARKQADAQELRTAQLRGELLPKAEVVRVWTTQITAAKSKLRALPAKARRQIPGVTAKLAKQLGVLIDDALTDLAGDGLQRSD